MKKLKVFISGQKWFAMEVLDLCRSFDNIEVVGVCCPLGDKYIGETAAKFNIPIIPSGMLNYDTMPEGVDLGITAHSFDYIGSKTRYKTKLGWIGYHPSLLPRHRGRSSIEWTIKMRDLITGGTIFWLNSGIDRGDIAYQDWLFVSSKYYQMDLKKASRLLWEHELQPMGLKLFKMALNDILNGIYIRVPQVAEFSTFEPSMDVKDIYKPDRLMIEEKCLRDSWM